ncbi:MAG: SMC-Scp complex subunit ScpB [Sphaerobacteraceae bacterium]|nr:MAG: SMC-Scp complex subunit ScpB [Sphaerobacteraceae bacterium]
MTEHQDNPDQTIHEDARPDAEQQQMPKLPESELPAAIVAMLFASSEPVSLQNLGRTTGYPVRQIRDVITGIESDMARLGLMMQWTDNEHVQIATIPAHAPLVRRLLGLERAARLSPAALEVLAVIGYRQPVTRPEIDAIRGVDSSGVIQTLVARELIEPVGRLPGPGNPVQFGTTGEFLRIFGLTSLEELPELPEELVDQLEIQPEETPAES